MRSHLPRIVLAALLIVAILAVVYRANAPSGDPFRTPPQQRWHVRPAEATERVGATFPAAEGWVTSAFEAAVPSGGVLTVAIEDRGETLASSAGEVPRGVALVVAGYRMLEPQAFVAAYPEAVSEEERRYLAVGTLDRRFIEWGIAVVCEPEGARGPSDTLQRGGVPGQHAPGRRAEIGSGRLGLAGVPFVEVAAGERLHVQDWIALPFHVRPFAGSFARLPDTVALDGRPTPLSEWPHPAWRVTLRWDEGGS